MNSDWSFKTDIKANVYGFEERYQPEMIDFEKDWEFERSSGHAGYRNKNSGEWIYDQEYREKKRAISHNTDVSDPTCVVTWSVDIDARDYGIKSISVLIKKVVGVVSWEVDCEEMPEEQKQKLFDMGGIENDRRKTIAGEIAVDSDGEIDGKKWEIKSEVKFSEHGSLLPTSVDIDFKTMMITIE